MSEHGREEGTQGRIGPKEAMARAVAAFQAHPGAEDEAIQAALEADGLSAALAARLIQFLPIAFCRVLLTPQGVRFPDVYHVMGPRGTSLGEYPLAEEPIFTEALTAARAEMQAGRGGAPYLAIAGRSAAFQSVMELIGKGSQPGNILCSPPILISDEPTWQRDLFAVAAPPRKPWWQRLRG